MLRKMQQNNGLNVTCLSPTILLQREKKAKSNDVYVCVYASYGFTVAYYCVGGVDRKFMEHK